MATFVYKAVDLSGREVSGELEAPDRTAALRELARQDACVTRIDAKSQRAALSETPGSNRLRIGSKQLAILTRQLATSLEAGLTLMHALDVMQQELHHRPSRELLGRLAGDVQHGRSLSDAMNEHPRIFSPLYIRMVRVGETGGMLDTMLGQLAEMLERQNDLRDRVRTASIYPSILLLVGLASVVIIVAVIVPRIIESLGTDTMLLPLPTRIMMGAGDFVRDWWYLLLAAVATGVFAFRHWVLQGPGRPRWDRFKLRVPIWGRLIAQTESSRFARSMGILVRGGVTITEALAAAKETVQNAAMRQAMESVAASIQSGESIARPLQRSGLFRPLLIQMVRIGENTGRLHEMLLKAADIHEAEARVTLDRVVTILPVLMILALAGIIGFIVAGLVLAIVEFQTVGVGG
ncbi:MAG: hypothetical protein GXY33_22470 [Phycisphaerae bacterium]|nr:hypothetical protein [Phycisphaerae bacterium]